MLVCHHPTESTRNVRVKIFLMFIYEKLLFSHKYIINKDYGYLFHLSFFGRVYSKKQTQGTVTQHIFKSGLAKKNIQAKISYSHFYLTLSWRRPLSYRNQSIDLICLANQWTGFYTITASVMKGLTDTQWKIGLQYNEVMDKIT